MITDRTEPIEAWRELAEDFPRIEYFKQKNRKNIQKRASQAGSFPFIDTLEYKSPRTNNTYKVYFRTIEEGNGMMTTTPGHFLPVQQRNGKRIYLYAPETVGESSDKDACIWVINPHFMSRYRERAGIDDKVDTSTLVWNLFHNFPDAMLSFTNHAAINRNFHRHNGLVDGENSNRYMLMMNGIAFVHEQVYKNNKSALPQHIFVIELRTFVDREHMPNRQKKAVIEDIKHVIDKYSDKGQNGTANVPDGNDIAAVTDLLNKGKEPKAKPAEDPVEKNRRAVEEFGNSMAKKYGVTIVDDEGNEKDGYDMSGFDLPTLNRGIKRGVERRYKKRAEKGAKQADRENTPAPERTFTDEEIADIAIAKAEGLTINRLAATYKTSPDVIRKVLKEKAAGIHTDRIAKHNGLTGDQVRTIVKDNKQAIDSAVNAQGTDKKIRYAQLTEDEKATILKLHGEGLLAKDIALRVFRSSYTVTEYLTSQGLQPLLAFKKLTREERAAIDADIAAGMTKTELMAKYDRPRSTIGDAIKRHKNASRKQQTTNDNMENKIQPKNATTTEEEKEQIYRLHAEGMASRDIAATLHRSQKTVTRFLREKGLTPILKMNRISPEQMQDILKDLEGGMPYSKIAAKYHFDVTGIRKAVKKYHENNLTELPFEDAKPEEAQPAAPSLESVSDEAIFQALYRRGFRIEGDDVTRREIVDLKQILNS